MEETEKRSVKQWVFEMIHGGIKGNRAARIFSAIIIILILLSVASMILESYESIESRFHSVFFCLEAVTVAVFTLEYLAGLWTADLAYPDSKHPRLRFMGSFMAIIELLAVLPFYLSLILQDESFLDITEFFQLLRLLHVLKLSEYNKPLHTLGEVIRESLPQLVTVVLIGLFGMLVGATVLYKVEHPIQPEVFPNIVASFRVVLSEATQSGIGSSVPQTRVGRVCLVLMELMGIGIIAVPIGIIASGMNHHALTRHQEEQKEEEKKFCPWCGHSLEDHPGRE